MIQLTGGEKAYLAMCLTAITVGAVVWVVVSTWGSVSRQHIDPDRIRPADPWPVVVRTVDGQVTTPMPEDLDR